MPPDLLTSSRLTEQQLRRSEDCFVDELFAGCVKLGMPMLRANLSRAYIDFNREPHELDPRMFADRLPGFANTATPRVLSGLGTIPRVVSDGEEIYRRKLMAADALHRIETCYRPYHRALRALLDEAHSKAGVVVLLDCHSMPATATTESATRQNGPDVILGDRFGSAADPDLVEALDHAFAGQGFRVRRNRPYAGGFITETYGNPRLHRHAIQIELSRSLYMNENTFTKLPAFSGLAARLEQVVAEFVIFLQRGGWRDARQLAAE